MNMHFPRLRNHCILKTMNYASKGYVRQLPIAARDEEKKQDAFYEAAGYTLRQL